MEDDKVYAEKLSDKMKRLENLVNYTLEKKKPVILRIDGRSFSKFTKNLDKPFDEDLSRMFQNVCKNLHTEMDNVKFIYSTSDEISILLTDWTNANTDAWYNYRLQKLVSVASSVVTVRFNEQIQDTINDYVRKFTSEPLELRMLRTKNFQEGLDDMFFSDEEIKYSIWLRKLFKAEFDCRAFNLDKDDVVPYFIFRQKDAIRNSISSLANANFSHKFLEGKNQQEKIDLIKEATGIDWNELSTIQKMGFAVYKDDMTGQWIVDDNIPEFMINRNYIQRFLD